MLSAVLVCVLREPPPSVVKPPPSGVARAEPVALGRDSWRVAGVLGVFSPVNSPARCCSCGSTTSGSRSSRLILACVAYNLVYPGLSYPAGVVADRLSAQQVVAVGLGCSWPAPWRAQ